MSKLEDYGFIQSKSKGEFHANNQTMSKLLHKAIGLGSGSARNDAAYEAYMKHFEVRADEVSMLRNVMWT